jgi:hypothetical protein
MHRELLCNGLILLRNSKCFAARGGLTNKIPCIFSASREIWPRDGLAQDCLLQRRVFCEPDFLDQRCDLEVVFGNPQPGFAISHRSKDIRWCRSTGMDLTTGRRSSPMSPTVGRVRCRATSLISQTRQDAAPHLLPGSHPHYGSPREVLLLVGKTGSQ